MTVDSRFIPRVIAGRISEYQTSTSVFPSNPNDPFWLKFAQALAGGGADTFQLADEHLRLLFSLYKTNFLRKTLPMLERVRYKPVGSFADIEDMCRNSQECSNDKGMSDKIRRILIEVFLFEINLRLQTMYHLYLSCSAIANKVPDHSALIGLTGGLESAAYQLLRSWNLPGMIKWLGYENPDETLGHLLRQLSNNFFQLESVNLRFTYHCNITCRHCYNSSGPHLEGVRIPLSRMLHIIEQMPSVNMRKLTITGGEPFLYLDDITLLVQHARRHGVTQIALLTNASWAISPDQTRNILLQLKASGFGMEHDNIKASAGIYHQEKVPLGRVLILIEAYFALFERPLNVDFEAQHANEEENFKQLLRAKGLFNKANVGFRGILPFGRGESLLCVPDLTALDTHCTNINQIVFDPDGKVRPCCGLNVGNQGIVIGTNDDLQSLVKSVQNNPILQFLARNPIKAIFPFTGNTAGIYCALCDACQDALGTVQDTEVLKLKLATLQEFFPFSFTREKLLSSTDNS